MVRTDLLKDSSLYNGLEANALKTLLRWRSSDPCASALDPLHLLRFVYKLLVVGSLWILLYNKIDSWSDHYWRL